MTSPVLPYADQTAAIAALDDDGLHAAHARFHVDLGPVVKTAEQVVVHHLLCHEIVKRGGSHGHDDPTVTIPKVEVQRASNMPVSGLARVPELAEAAAAAVAKGLEFADVVTALSLDGWELTVVPVGYDVCCEGEIAAAPVTVSVNCPDCAYGCACPVSCTCWQGCNCPACPTPTDTARAGFDMLLDGLRNLFGKTRTEKAAPRRSLVSKADEAYRFTLGPMYIPDSIDAHGEWTDAGELQPAVWDYVREGDRRIRLQHNTDIVAGEWVEVMTWPYSVTVPMVDPDTGETSDVTYPANTAFLGVIWEPWAWALVLAGKLRGYSIGGTAEYVMAEFDQEESK